MNSLLERFLRYTAYDTQSDADAVTRPSTVKQVALLTLLTDELQALGIANARLDEHSFVTAHIAANNGKTTPGIGFIAHVDTSPDVSGASVQAKIISTYNGGDILLNDEKQIYLRVADQPELATYKGQTLITTDGTTLLGADDKAGIAIIMQLAQHLMLHPEQTHGDIYIAFTPDEEIGRGVDGFDVQAFGADFAYTVDGGQIGELEYENFNAALAVLTVYGCNIHPGYAFGKLKNALSLLQEFNALLPSGERPETTVNREGFYFLHQMQGNAGKASAQYLIRDHDRELFNRRKLQLEENAAQLNRIHGEGTFSLQIKDQYYNMRDVTEQHFHLVENAIKAMEMAGVKPLVQPVRGGTDGARLSFMGLPCPNLFAGGHNFHSIYEYVPLESMQKSLDVILNIVKLYSV
ncbi:MAG: peptidase T [Prevotellaceae bacterium]|jgi:tripeptide aminopeptidase|nr:peptidase T [Prevotellaceae bacterium]